MTAPRYVVIGADTHLDTIHLAVITDAGKSLADSEFATSPAGYEDAVRWARSFGSIAIAGVEGTSSYGAGLTRVLQAAGVEVAEVSRPDRAARRRQGKSDPLDAYAAARAALAGHGTAVPKDASTGAVRALLSARRSAVKAHTAATNQIHALLVTGPVELRERYRRHSTTALITALARCRPAAHDDPTTIAVLTAAKALAQRAVFLERQKQDLTAQLEDLVAQINPALRAAHGVGADTAAQLLVTAGTNPHRLRTDYPENVPEWLWKYFDTALFRPTVTDPDSQRGHYFFSLAEDQRFGCGLGKLKPPKGEKWGEVKCFGGAIILGPTLHPDTLSFHAYHCAPGGNPIPVPEEIAEKLNAPPDLETYRLLTPRELEESAKQFIATYTDEKEPWALAPILDNFDPTPNYRHASMYETLCWAMREAKAGRFSAQRALDELKALWDKSFGVPDG